MLKPSPSESSAHHEDEVPPLDASHAVPQLSDAIPVTYPPLPRAEEHVDAAESSRGIGKLKLWIQMRTKKNNKDPTSHKPNRITTKARRPADPQPPSQSPARVNATNEGPSRMAAGQRVPASTFFDRRSDVMRLTYHLSEWSRHRSWIRMPLLPRVCMQEYVRPYSLNCLSMTLTLAIRTKMALILDKALRIRGK